ncbi:MAG: hypothetical protein LBP67_05295 [Bacteroidales bacterium]|jgi:hypothetical protein|nr:hypothetical protein [Bacteroidales bacterium]
MKTKITKFIAILLFCTIPFTFQRCDNPTIDDILEIIAAILSQTGWLEDSENMNNIPEDITPFNDDEQELADRISLENIFPPIGNQGSYGTCITWSVGYNLKTALNAIENEWTSTQLANSTNQTSPKDLWMSIPSADKGSSCQGTNFEPALDALIKYGAANMNSVPYTNMGNCNGSYVGNVNNKLTNYRKIASEAQGLTPENFKGYLNSGRPIAIGAKLGDRFMNWNSSAIISYDTYNNPGMDHAYHAMVLSGYDDSKNAFRVRNSWGSSWGDNGSIWIDYDFFCNSFCFAAFVAQNVNSITIGSNGINTGDLSSGYDLLAYYAEDNKSSSPDFTREFTYDVYNAGNQNINPSQRWSVVYMYYNATDANDYQIIFEDYYTDEFGEGNGYYNEANGLVGGWWNNASVESGKKAGEAEYPEGFIISYNMPKITGSYYLVVMADAYDVISEVNEDNNFYFITAENGKPLEFIDGEVQNMLKSNSSLKSSRPTGSINTETQTVVKPNNLNAYTSTELKIMLINEKRSGRLETKMNAFRYNGGNKDIKRAVK